MTERLSLDKRTVVVRLLSDANSDELDSDLKYGLEDQQSRTLEEAGKVVNLTRERVRQIEARPIRMIRQNLRGRV